MRPRTAVPLPACHSFSKVCHREGGTALDGWPTVQSPRPAPEESDAPIAPGPIVDNPTGRTGQLSR